ncbi:MAG TPA: CvpA family protein [Gammaproteobacteria bacterium]|nr:CvpA family protein [Gammaproteobacteria bacterium]
MNWADYLIIAIIAVSALISLVRGFVREVLSIVVWVAAFWLAIVFARPFASLLSRYIESPMLQVVAAFAVIFVGTLLVGAIVGFFGGLLVDKTGLTGTDRAIGVVFGAARGLILTALLILVLGLTRMPQEAWWRQSTMINWLQPLVCEFAVGEWMRGFTVYTPVTQGVSVAPGRPARDYWADFCKGVSTPTTTDR